MLLQHKEDIVVSKILLKNDKGTSRGKCDKNKEQKAAVTSHPACSLMERYQLGFVKEEVELLILVAVAPVTVNPAGGAIELWLG